MSRNLDDVCRRWRRGYNVSAGRRRRVPDEEAEANYRAAMERQLEVVALTQAVLKEQEIPTAFYVQYMAFARRADKLARKYAGEMLRHEHMCLLAYWVGRGISQAVGELVLAALADLPGAEAETTASLRQT
jgi:hypothetical protein